jgi:hypothetical protein
MEIESMRPDQQIHYLELEVAQLKAEATRLRKALHLSSRHAKRIEKAVVDALLLAMWRTSGVLTSRDFAKKHGMTQNRWQNAVALLKMARVIQRHRYWVTDDTALIEARLASVRTMALEHPDAFWARLNRHGRR